MTTPALNVAVRLPCETREEFVRRFGPELAKGTLFVATRAPKAPGTRLKLELKAKDGTTLLRALADVARLADDPARPGMHLSLRAVDEASRAMLAEHGIEAPGARPEARADGRGEADPPRPPSPSTSPKSPPIASGRPSSPTTPPQPSPIDSPQTAAPPSALPPTAIPDSPAPAGAEAAAPPSDPAPAPRSIPRTGPVVGIDLGTTNSCVAFAHHGKPVVIPSREGYNTVPSVVAMTDKGRLLVGQAAKGQLLTNPRHTVHGAKRLVGRPFHSTIVSGLAERFSYDIVEGPGGEAAVALGGKTYTLQEISALVLKELREVARGKLGQDVTRAVITVPAYYNDHQRQAVREAGLLAGLHVEALMSEPTAAALAFGYGKQLDKRILVYDLGGGTFDVSVLELAGGNVYEVVSTGGDTFLGGVDFDLKLLDLFLERFEKTHGLPFDGDRVALQRMLDQAERTKLALSESTSQKVHVPFVALQGDKPLHLDCEVTRDELVAVTSHLVERTLEVTGEVLQAKGLKATDVDEVLLVGGQSRMPLVRERLKAYFGKEPHKGVHPDEAVALGAALFAQSIATEAIDSVVLIDVLPMSIGVGLPGGRFKRVIERNTKLPHTRAHTLQTTKDGQTSLEVAVFQGDSERAVDNEFLGHIRLSDLPKAPRGAVKVDLTFKLSREGLLTIVTREDASGAERQIVLATRDTPAEVRRKLDDAAPAPAAPTGLWGRVKRLFGARA